MSEHTCIQCKRETGAACCVPVYAVWRADGDHPDASFEQAWSPEDAIRSWAAKQPLVLSLGRAAGHEALGPQVMHGPQTVGIHYKAGPPGIPPPIYGTEVRHYTVQATVEVTYKVTQQRKEG